MTSENKLPPYQQSNHPEVTFKRMFDIVEDLNKRLLSKREVVRTAKGIDQDSLGRTSVTDPPLGSSFADPVLKLSRHLSLLKDRLLKLEKLQEGVKKDLHEHLYAFDKLENLDTSGLSLNGINRFVESISMKISDLLCEVPLVPDKQVEQRAVYSQENGGSHFGRGDVYIPGIHTNEEDLTRCKAFREVTAKFQELDTNRKICLLSFSVFPENREVHRTMLMYWWIGEGIIPVEGAEEAVREVLKDFTEKKLIEPVQDRRKVAPNSYKMTPIVHSSVVLLSMKVGFIDIYHKGCKPEMHRSDMGKVFLVEGSASQPEAGPRKMPLEDIETVFNVSEINPDFAIHWFSKTQQYARFNFMRRVCFRSLRVLYLGRWERTQKRKIEVHNHELMRFLKHLRRVKVLSFQGISTIRSLHKSIGKIPELIILDLRECYGLTKLPEKIGSLLNLVYLDMTGCYMLEWIPLRLAWLKNLEVIKGFVVSDSLYDSVACKLIYLKNLTKLRKLSIEINRDDLDMRQLMVDLVELKALTSLKVKWRMMDLYNTRPANPLDYIKIVSLIDQLNKLDLQCFPHEELPTWLHPQDLLRLKKFHIGGGRRLKDFGYLPKKATKCSVKVLRLTSLPKLRVGWIELKKIYFPNMIFLEKYECPRVTLTPCDANGIWRSDQD